MSINDAWAPKSVTMSPQSTPMMHGLQSRLQCHHRAHLCTSVIFVLTPHILEVTQVHQCGNVDFVFVFSCFQNYLLFFALYLILLPSLDRFQLFPFSLRCCLCIRNFHRLHKLLYQIKMVHGVKFLASDVIFVTFQQSWFHSLPGGFMRPSCTSVFSLRNLVGCAEPRYSFLQARQACGLLFTRHCRFHRHFQLSPRIFDGLFEFFVFRIIEVDASHSSSIVDFRLLVCPFLFFSFLSGFSNLGPYFRPHMIWSRGRLNFCQSPPGPHFSFGRLLFQ